MNIPYWLFKLLPMWDYICPKCKKEVKKNSYKCPYCREQYGKPVRVPPKVLKDPKALEDYVHKHIFPRVSKFQRDYLTQFFTELFNNDFEEGNFSAWTGTGGSPAVVGSPVHHGSYAMQVQPAVREECYKDISAQANPFARIYWQCDTAPDSDSGDKEFLHMDTTTADRVRAGVYDSGGTQYWKLWVGGSSDTSVVSLAVDTWYCVEVEFDSNDDTHYMWVDGNLVCTVSFVSSESVDSVAIGQFASLGGWSGNWYIDCVVVADAYIGEEAEGVPVPVMVHHLKQQGIM